MVDIVSGGKTDKWLPKLWRKCTFPVLSQPARTLDDITASAFLIEYNKILYIVTAKHVAELLNPVIVFGNRDRKMIFVTSSDLEQEGLKWIKHPAGLDIAAIPFRIPSRFGEIDVFPISAENWARTPVMKIGDWVAHLGYPDKGTSRYHDRLPCIIPQAMPGPITHLEPAIRPYRIIMKTAGVNGASGGPVFLKGSNGTCLVGVVIEARKKGTVFLNITIALFASLIKDILELDLMTKQVLVTPSS